MSIKHLKRIALLLIFLFACSGVGLAEDDEFRVRDFSGRWKVMLSNSLGRKLVTFQIDQESGRLRGTMLAKGMPEMPLDGRFEKDDRVILWGTHYERTGQSFEYQFKGSFEGEPGEETIEGTARYFSKTYKFTAERS